MAKAVKNQVLALEQPYHSFLLVVMLDVLIKYPE